MRRTPTRLPVAALAAFMLSLPATATAAPKLSVKVRVLPVLKDQSNPKAGFWPHTGDLPGAPASLETSVTATGTEYGGYPAPIRKVVVYLPKGTGIHTAGFPTCPISLLDSHEPEKCPKGSLASPAGHAPQSAPESCPPPAPLAGGASEACGVVSLGDTRVHEAVKIQAYIAPGNGLNFYIEGVTPTSIEEPFAGKFEKASGIFGTKFTTYVPLINTLPGAPAAVAETTTVTIGAAIMKGKKLISLGTVPKRCPNGGFPGKGELWFGAGEEPTWEEVTINVKVPCPKK